MEQLKKYKGVLFVLLGITFLAVTAGFRENKEEGKIYRSPETVAYSPDGELLAVNDLTLNRLYIIDPTKGKKTHEIKLEGKGQDIVWLNDDHLLVSEYETGKVLKINAGTGKTEREYSIGPNAFHMAVHKHELWIGLYGLKQIAVFDLSSGNKTHSIDIQSLSWDMQIAEKAGYILVTNLIPGRAANTKETAASITFIDLKTKKNVKNILLPHGASNLRHLEVSEDGNWAYAVHTRGKIALPTSQLEKGWVNTNMLSILNLNNATWYTSVLLDKVRQGASDPWDVVENAATGELLVSLAGVHELATIKLEELHNHLRGEKAPENLQANNAGAFTAYDVWQKVKNNPEDRIILKDQISALYAAGLIERENIPLKAPRGLDLAPDNASLAIAGYYSGSVAIKDLKSESIKVISLGLQSSPGEVRRGEIFFHDASKTLETWLSCFSCHPDTRADGLNWDLLNDGIGNPKNTKSLVWTHLTPPAMSTGVRPNYEVAVEKGFHFIKFYEGLEKEKDEVRAYLASLTPDKSPYLKLAEEDEKFMKSVERGKLLFKESKCINCHEPPLFTNKKQYDFGVADEQGITVYDVPTLKELWRTAPYWHNGSRATLEEVITNEEVMGVHGETADLNSRDVNDLTNYLLTL